MQYAKQHMLDMQNQARVLEVTKRELQDQSHELHEIKLEQAKLKGQPNLSMACRPQIWAVLPMI